MSKVHANIRNPFMDLGFNEPRFVPFGRPFGLEFPTLRSLSQPLRIGFEYLRVLNLSPVAEGSKAADSQVYANTCNRNSNYRLGIWEFTAKTGEPFAGRRSMNGAGFDLPFNRTMHHSFHSPDLGELDRILQQRVASLGVSYAVVAPFTLEAGKILVLCLQL